ncbi:MAG: bifunctional phosphopantothenoylcysteine decarboxylase/phosphopantothenate--cysteine ligase CoaBC, partial [Pseudomonadota bacterium]|nr:bifunctional phosphopantothenoylcysteine decarboxylase/phosphopantothenate--cysteine ligase CoaBC [Pseudomonadota bacterium]
MNQGMWANQANLDNIELLQQRQVRCFGPAEGSQACGDIGPGRMLEAEELAQLCSEQFQPGSLAGKTVTITAGPTREAIDPVRYISNHSSGKMGYAIAEAARDAGAKVIVISGPCALTKPERCEVISVSSAQEMYEASMAVVTDSDIFIASAAVADYRPASIEEQKIKKTGQDTMTIELVKNPDIVTAVANSQERPFTVGFAAETQDVVEYARGKLQRKNLDLVVANDVSRTDIGFNSDDNAVTLVWPDSSQDLALQSKAQLACELVQRIADALPE